MPEPLVLTVGIAGIILIGLAFTAINLVKGAARLIGLGLLGFLFVVLLNRMMSPSGNLTSPNSNFPNSSNSPNFPNSSNSPNFPNSSTSPTYPSSPNSSTSPDQRRPSSFSLDSVSRGISDFVKSVSKGLDQFVYGDPYAVEPPSDQQTNGQYLEPDSSQSGSLPPGQPSYQIRPDGVPSRVSTLVVPEDSAASTGTSGAPSSNTGTSVSRPVSAWW